MVLRSSLKAANRDFVLVPLRDLAPDLVPDPPVGTGVRQAGIL
jgi:7,8-dihydro-6-hydroxymethylpterin-pyrophosphokinase